MKQISLAIIALLALGGCNLTPETWVNSDRVEVHDDQFTDTFELASLTDQKLRAIANVYERYGDGSMRVGVVSSNRTAVSRIEKSLKQFGVRDLKIDRTNPERGAKDMVVVSFPALVAMKPESCGMMPGANGITTLPDSGQGEAPYGFGCTIETMLARQVYKPKDLLGRDGFDTNADGARAEGVNARRGYYGDQSYPDLNGEKASGNN